MKETRMQKELYDVVVIGAGIVGCSVSYHLAKAGLKVALIDKGSVAGEASQAASGMLAPLGDEPPDQAHPLQQFGMAALNY
jgi:glycine/D-amino acid oxidase-like deaminating enzyme